MPRWRPQASCLRQVESYLCDMGIAGLASAWAMARRRPKEYRRQVDAATCCSGVCLHILPEVQYILSLQDSLKVISTAMADSSVNGAKVYDKFQFERTGFFSVDPDTTPSKVSNSVLYSELCKRLIQLNLAILFE